LKIEFAEVSANGKGLPMLGLIFCRRSPTMNLNCHDMNVRTAQLIFFLILIHCVANLLAAEPQLNRSASASSEPLSLWYRQPAANWTEALPVGNGRLGAMVFGGISRERLQLNEDTLWGGGPYDPVKPQACVTIAGTPEAKAAALAEVEVRGSLLTQ
jgi:hypothetical protein